MLPTIVGTAPRWWHWASVPTRCRSTSSTTARPTTSPRRTCANRSPTKRCPSRPSSALCLTSSQPVARPIGPWTCSISSILSSSRSVAPSVSSDGRLCRSRCSCPTPQISPTFWSATVSPNTSLQYFSLCNLHGVPLSQFCYLFRLIIEPTKNSGLS